MLNPPMVNITNTMTKINPTINSCINGPFRIPGIQTREYPNKDINGDDAPCPDAVPDDGLLDFVVVPAVSRLTILTLIGKYAKGGAGDIPRILLRRGREMHVACERADRINLDGEELVDSELSVRVSAKKVNFFFPEGTHWIPEKRVRN